LKTALLCLASLLLFTLPAVSELRYEIFIEKGLHWDKTRFGYDKSIGSILILDPLRENAIEIGRVTLHRTGKSIRLSMKNGYLLYGGGWEARDNILIFHKKLLEAYRLLPTDAAPPEHGAAVVFHVSEEPSNQEIQEITNQTMTFVSSDEVSVPTPDMDSLWLVYKSR
jgi:hypothetical protein